MITIKKYLSLVKFSHTIFAMPFAMIGFALAVYHVTSVTDPAWHPGWYATIISKRSMIYLLGLVIICMVTARSAAMAFNRYLDRHFDAQNPRTAIREIPKGLISPGSALWFVILSSILFITATYFINPMCFYLSPVALFVILFYSYTKRFTPLCHLVLGLGLALAPIGAYLAIVAEFDLLPLLFSFTVIFWVSGFDIIYALQDVEFDQSHKLYSIPAALGKKNALRVSELLHVLSAACVIAAGFTGDFHWIYWIGVGIFAGMLVYQHSIVKPDDLRRVNIAFMTANGIASIVFGILVVTDLALTFIHTHNINIHWPG